MSNKDDCISRRAAIDLFPNDALEWDTKGGYIAPHLARRMIEELPPAQPDIIRCRNCKFASGDSRICMKFGHSPIGELDFCAWAERRIDGQG